MAEHPIAVGPFLSGVNEVVIPGFAAKAAASVEGAPIVTAAIAANPAPPASIPLVILLSKPGLSADIICFWARVWGKLAGSENRVY